MAVGAGAFGAAPPGDETPAVPQQATIKPAGQAEWGPPAGGLVVSLGLDGEAAAGGRIAFRIRIRSAAGQPVALAAAKDAAGWVVIAQSLGGEKKAVYSRRVAMADLAPDWPAELAADKTLALNPVDLGAGPAWGSDAARELLLAYVSGKAGPDLPKPAGKLSECLAPGRAMARFTLCLPAPGAKPVLVTSGALDFTVSPPNLASMKPESRDAFAADLLKQFDRNPWSGQQAHNTAVRVGKEVLAPIIAAAFETARPGHARLWLATTVADIRDERSADALIKLLDDSMDGVRYVVAYHGPKQESPRLDKAIVQRAAAGKDPGLAAWALMGFMVHRGAVPEEVLRAGLESDDPRARAAVAEALAGHASDFNVSRLVRLLGDANERVRATAAAMLGKSGNRSPPVLAGLVNALDLPGEAARTRICAALSELTGRTAPYDPKADPAARGKTVAGWKQWLAEQPKK
jgi:hypothetical protein